MGCCLTFRPAAVLLSLAVATKLNTSSAWNDETLRAFPPEKRYLVAVSGGRDSMALLHWLASRGYQRLIVCHLDHQLRGRTAQADARFVQRATQASGLDVELGSTDVPKLAAATKQSVEVASRTARYHFFAAVARRRRCRTIFLGHHADDQVETFLINLFRGAGMQGLRAMQTLSRRTINNVELTIVRPLLSVSRAEIDSYIEAHAIRFREDASNKTLTPLRNRLRHRIIPMIEKEFGRAIHSPIRRAATIATAEDAMLDAMLPPFSAALRVKKLLALPLALQRRMLAKWLQGSAVSDIGFDVVEEVRSLLDVSGGPAKVNLPGDRHARRRAGELFIE